MKNQVAMKDPEKYWEIFLLGREPMIPITRSSLRLRLRGMYHVVRALCYLRTNAWDDACCYLERIQSFKSNLSTLAPVEAVRLALTETLFSQITMRMLMPTGQCLPRSLALTAYLLGIGLPAKVVIGRDRFPNKITPNSNFHAWTELYGETLNEAPIMRKEYNVLQIVPSND